MNTTKTVLASAILGFAGGALGSVALEHQSGFFLFFSSAYFVMAGVFAGWRQ